ncbi:Uncharacterised protein [Mycobacteroides abscessus subsp. abscessus]|nr:Uncharacterised protein [Mycobacteroides abscessus subsp. abscessus]
MAATPAAVSALSAARTAIVTTVSSGPAKRRSVIPVRVRIHSSSTPRWGARSELEMTRCGLYDPIMSIPARVAVSLLVAVILLTPLRFMK